MMQTLLKIFEVFSKSSRSLQLIFWSFVNNTDSNYIDFVSMYKTSYNKIHLLWKVVEFTVVYISNISNKRTIDRIAEPQPFFTQFKMLILVITIEAYVFLRYIFLVSLHETFVDVYLLTKSPT